MQYDMHVRLRWWLGQRNMRLDRDFLGSEVMSVMSRETTFWCSLRQGSRYKNETLQMFVWESLTVE